MEVIWVALIVLGFCLILAFLIGARFPDEVRRMLRRTKAIEMSPTGVAWTFFEEAVIEKEEHRPDRDEVEPTLRRIGGGRVLWVDDNPDNNRLETEALRALGVEVDVASSNDEALGRLEEEEFDVVLSDIDRGREGPQAGLDLPRRMRERQAKVPIAFYIGEAIEPTTPAGDPVFDAPTDLLGYLADRLSRGEGGDS